MRCFLTILTAVGGTVWLQGQVMTQPTATTEAITTDSAAVASPRTEEGASGPSEPRSNFRIGGASVRVVTGISGTYSDNINYSEFNRKSDFIIQPNLQLNLLWPITQANTFTFDLGIGYDYYVENSNTGGLVVTPDTELNFRVRVGEYVTINFFDRFSFEQSPLDAPTISNTLDYTSFNNTLGYLLTWEVNKFLEIDHGYSWTAVIFDSSEFNYLDRNTHTLTHNFRFHVNPAVQTGILSNISFTDYDKYFQNDNAFLRVGPFVRAKVSENTEVAGQVMFVGGVFDAPTRQPGRSNFDSSDITTVNASGSITNRLNRHLSQRLEAGYDTRLGTDTNYYDIAYGRYAMDWQLMTHLTLNLAAFYEYGMESGGLFSEDFHRYGGGLGFNYRLTKSTTAGIRYDYIEKDSNQFGRDYYQNRVTLEFNYRF